ncbi:MAG: PhoH family protein [Halanaerobiales bacterium]
MKKLFVVDTNVLLDDPKAIFAFEENIVILPLAVVEEIDNQKQRGNSIGHNARETSRILDGLRKKGRLNKGVELEQGGILRIVIDGKDLILPAGLSSTKMDNRIISTAIHLKNDNPEKEVILVSNDINMRLMADAFGLKAEEYLSNRLRDEEIYTGIHEFNVSHDIIDIFYKENSLDISALEIGDVKIYPQEMIQLNAVDRQSSAIARYDGNKIVPLYHSNVSAWGIKPRNREQKFAMELLLNDSIKMVTLMGKAGTGKTLLALAAGLMKVTDEEAYKRLLVARPIVPMGNDLGYLPGSKEEKLQPWMQPIFDNLELILNTGNSSDFTFEYLVEKNLIQIEALTYIRGRSVPNQYIIVDEAQNLTPHEIKTIITRAGKNTKIVFTGDPYQIDNPYLDLHNNGLTHLANSFHKQEIAGHITLVKGERSELARIASNLL